MWDKRDRLTPSSGRRFNRGGRIGRAPGLGPRNLAGTTPGSMGRSSPRPGYGLSVFRRHPKKGSR